MSDRQEIDARDPVHIPSGIQTKRKEPTTWGFCASLLWVLGGMIIPNIPIAMAFQVWYQTSLRLHRDVSFFTSPILDTVAIIPVVFVIYLATRIVSDTVAQYIGLIWPRRRHLLIGLIFAILYIVVSQTLLVLFGYHTILSCKFIDAYRLAQDSRVLAILLTCVVIVSPSAEEIVFRGFLFRSLENSKVWIPGAIVISTILWLGIHVPYDLTFLSIAFVFGLMLGILRWKSGSVVPTILTHSAFNAAVMLECSIAAHGLWM